MNLHNTVARYMTETFVDPYHTATSFLGAIRPFSEVTNSGDASRRRVLETQPTVTMFSDRVIRRGSEYFLVGGLNVDMWRGAAIRHKYPLVMADMQVTIGSINEVITNVVPSRVVYAGPQYSRGTIMDSEASDTQSIFSFIFPSPEVVAKGEIVIQGSNYWKLRQAPYLDGALFLVAEAILLEAPKQTLSYVSKTGYNATTDTITNGSTTSITTFVEDAYLAYDHTSERYSELQPGDKNITCRPAAAPKPGETLGAYKILTVDTQTDGSYSCHCRRVA